MSSKKKKNKKPVQTQQGGYKRFLIEMYDFLVSNKSKENFNLFSNDLKRKMYAHLIKINNPVAENEHITSNEVKTITKLVKKLYRATQFNVEGDNVSTHHMQLYHCYMWALSELMAKEAGDKNHPEVLEHKEICSNLSTAFYTSIIKDNFKMVTRLSSPDFKYYGIRIRMAAIYKEDPKLEYIIELYGFPAKKYLFDINGNKRPAFRLGKAMATEIVEWISVDTSYLGDFYKGESEKIEVYIQSHALKRLKERLDLMDKEAVSYALWTNTHTLEDFIFYKKYLLLPFKVFDVKIGYLAANIIDDKLIFRTFLFITHSSTPEGDCLKELTGLGKHDISYWKIDRLSTYVNLDEEKHPELINFFKEAGLEELIQLKDKEFDIDTIQSDNFNALIEYLNKNKESMALTTSEESNLVEIN